MAVFPGEVLVDLYATMGDVRAMMSGLALAAQCLVLVSILIGVLAVLSARRRQIAVLRALGAPRGFVFAVIWLQIAGLVAAGAVLGLGLGVGAAYGLSQLAEARFGVALPLSIGPDEWTTVAIAAGLGMVLAAIPAAIGYRQSIAAALKADL
jgi:putative ABC transport system permease protein